MIDRNQCTFVGHIDSGIKRAKTQNGEDYIAFLLNCEPKANANSTENNRYQMISIRCFKPNVIKYLDKLNIHRGTPIIVFGFVSSYPTEVKGKQLTANSINANEIYVIKTS